MIQAIVIMFLQIVKYIFIRVSK